MEVTSHELLRASDVMTKGISSLLTCQLHKGLSCCLQEHSALSRVSDEDSWTGDRGEGHRALEFRLHGHTDVAPWNDSSSYANRALRSPDSWHMMRSGT